MHNTKILASSINSNIIDRAIVNELQDTNQAFIQKIKRLDSKQEDMSGIALVKVHGPIRFWNLSISIKVNLHVNSNIAFLRIDSI